MKTIHMGLNTDPAWIRADEIIQKYQDDDEMVERWKHEKSHSLELRNRIIQAVEEDGECELSWSCTGRTRHEMHAHQWAEAMPEYEFEIGYNYHCIVRKKVEG